MSYSKVEPYPTPGTYEEDHIAKRDALDKIINGSPLMNAINEKVDVSLNTPAMKERTRLESEALTILDQLYGYEGRVNHHLTKQWANGEITLTEFHNGVLEVRFDYMLDEAEASIDNEAIF